MRDQMDYLEPSSVPLPDASEVEDGVLGSRWGKPGDFDHSANTGKSHCRDLKVSVSSGVEPIGVQTIVLIAWLTGNSGEIPGRSPPL